MKKEVPANSTRRLTLIAAFSAAGIALYVFESFIPMPLPFIKVGLANIASVLSLAIVGIGGMFAVIVLRIVVGGLLVGSFMGPAFILALSAGIASGGAMALASRAAPRLFSPFGISLIGSVVHVLVQLAVVRYAYVKSAEVFTILPLLALSALGGGLVVGFAALTLLRALQTLRTS